MSEEKIRYELTLYGKKIVEKNLVSVGGGNISAREKDFIYLSPSGYALDEINEDQWVKINLNTGDIIDSPLKPTCEIEMHLVCYKSRQDIRAVIHTHPPYVVGVTSANIQIEPMFPDFVVYLGKKVPLLDYITPGGKKLAKAIEKIIGNYNVVCLKNHGVITTGLHLKEAFYRNILIEEAAKIIFISKTLGNPHFFTSEEKEEIENLPVEAYRRKILKEKNINKKR